jgi:hypothetical protein
VSGPLTTRNEAQQRPESGHLKGAHASRPPREPPQPKRHTDWPMKRRSWIAIGLALALLLVAMVIALSHHHRTYTSVEQAPPPPGDEPLPSSERYDGL